MKKILFLLLFTSFSLQNYANDPIGKITKVANKIVEETRFDFQLERTRPNRYFDFIEVLNFGQTFGDQKAVAFAYTEIDAPQAQKLSIQVSHSDGLVVILNGKSVYQKEGKRTANLDRGERATTFDFDFPVELKKGKNTLLVKSHNDGKGEWVVYLQPSGALVFDENSNNEKPRIGLENHPLVTKSVSELSNWLMLGPFKKKTLADQLGPEKMGLAVGKVYESKGTDFSWTLPKLNIMGDVMNRHPLWGGYVNYNYHTGGVAWAMMHLTKATGDQRYDDYAKRYTDFHIKTKSFVGHQVYDLYGFRSANHHLFETPLLDFTLAPSMPYIYRLIQDKSFANRTVYEDWVAEISDYALNEQIRSPEGHYWRYTPKEYTTWTDDMFMGLPYLMHMAELTDDAALKQRLYDDASSQVFAFNAQTWNEEDQLYQHAQYTDKPVKMPYWTRANGWGIWATTEVLLRLPKDHKNYQAILKHFKNHVASVVKYKNDEGFWYNVIDA
ncbi:MAG: glycoside hydrolase family 88 protein, partial [Bacteroidota bacterium]